MLSISPSKVREIDDPVTKTLMQLHKIIYIDQVSYATSNISHVMCKSKSINADPDMYKIVQSNREFSVSLMCCGNV